MKHLQKYLVNSFFSTILFSTFFIACNNKKCIDAPDVSGMDVLIKIERIDKKLHKISSKAEMEELLSENTTFANEFLKLQEYPEPGILIQRFYNLMNDPGIDSLFIEVDRTFGDLDDIRTQFEDAFRYVKYYYPDTKVPKIQTAVTGIANDLYLSDSLFIIGLDYYLGLQGKYYPYDMPGYIMKRYQKDYLVPQIMLMYANLFNKTEYADKTALADMVYYGKAYHMAKALMPCTPDSLLTGYSTFETQDIEEHEQVIWASLLENEVLYDKNPYIKDKFLSERPVTTEIGENCPGRIGRWVGWRIVDKYMAQNPEITLPELMAIEDAQKIFNESKYKPIPY